MSLNDMFNQLMQTYGRPAPNAMQQHMMTLLSPYKPQDPTELPFKQCTDCQEITIIANVKYTDKQLLMNVIDLLTQCRIYHCDLDNWGRKPDADKTYYNLRPFIQAAYQCCLSSETMTAGQGGYASHNPFVGLTQEEANGSNNDTVGTMETIAKKTTSTS
jgi:hypothetical protein